MKKILSLLLIFVLFSCTDKEIEFKSNVFELTTKTPCDEGCTKVRIDVPLATNKTIIADSINAHLLAVSKQIVYFGDMSDIDIDYPKIMQSFILSFNEMQELFPEEIIPWEATVEGQVVYQSDELINIEISYYNYAGGVHGFYGIKSLIIDKETGSLLSVSALLKDPVAFTSIAEVAFKKANNIPMEDAINSTGFMFENDLYKLPQTLFVSDKGVALFYNAYEVSSTKESPTEVFLPIEKVGDLLNYR